MNIKHNHTCSFCGNSKTCFAFNEFETILSICRDCFEEVDLSFENYTVVFSSCTFCGREKDVKVIEGFDAPMFFSKLTCCDFCLNKLKELIKSANEEDM